MRVLVRSFLVSAAMLAVACGDDGGDGGGGATPTSTTATTSTTTSTTASTATSGSSSTGGQLSATDREKAAIVFASCIPDAGANSALRFMLEDGFFPGTDAASNDAYLACLAQVDGGCAEAYACGMRFSTDGDNCLPSCNGNVFTACDDTSKFVADCSVFGLECIGASCRPPGTAACADGAPDTCDGATRVSCSSGGYVQRDPCGPGQLCAIDDTDPMAPSAYCKSSDTPCNGAAPQCNGGAIESCDFFDNILTEPCAPGDTCHDSGAFPYCGPAEVCDPYGPPTCNGTILTACHAGLVVTVDCAALGFTSCMSAAEDTRCGPGW